MLVEIQKQMWPFRGQIRYLYGMQIRLKVYCRWNQADKSRFKNQKSWLTILTLQSQGWKNYDLFLYCCLFLYNLINKLDLQIKKDKSKASLLLHLTFALSFQGLINAIHIIWWNSLFLLSLFVDFYSNNKLGM